MNIYTYGGYKHEHGENKYKITEDGTAYNIDTNENVVTLLQHARLSGARITIEYGKDGTLWGDKETGTIGRSTGTFKVPLLIKTKRSTGGCAILTDCIARITTSKGKHVVYTNLTK